MRTLRFVQTKYDTLSIAKKAALWFTMSSILLKGVSFFTAPLFATLLSEYEFGKLSLFVSYEQIIIIFSTWSAGLGAYRTGLFKFRDDIPSLTNAVQIFSNILTIATFGLIACFLDQFVNFTGFSACGLMVMFVYVLTSPAFRCWETKAKIDYNYKRTAVVTTLLSLTQTMTALTAVLVIDGTADVKYIFMTIPAILCNLVILANQFSLQGICKNKSIIWKQIKFIAAFSFPLVFHSLSFLILAQADRIMIGKMIGEAQAGIYSVAYTIASITLIIQNAATEAFVPWLFRSLEQQVYDQINKQFTRLLILFGGAYLVFIMVAPEVIILLYPQSYHQGIWCIPPIAIGTYFMFFYSVFVNIQEYYGETRYIALVSCVCALLNIVLNYFGIVYFGYVACAYTTLLCYVFFAIGHYVFMCKVLRKRAIGTKIFTGRYLLLVAVVVLVFMAAITVIYPYTLIRYLILMITFPVVAFFLYKYWVDRMNTGKKPD